MADSVFSINFSVTSFSRNFSFSQTNNISQVILFSVENEVIFVFSVTEQRDDIEFSTERLVVRCLTVDVSVMTPRNENQEEAYKSVSEILNSLHLKVKQNPLQHEKEVLSHLNACLAEPLSNNINLRFQGKVLSCTADDQKLFRKRLEEMLDCIRRPEENVDLTNSCSTEESQNYSQNGTEMENGTESSQSEADTSEGAS